MKQNQNLLIAQVVGFLNKNGYLAWRQENNGRIDEDFAVSEITRLLVALAHVNYSVEKVAPLVRGIIRRAYRPVPSSLKGVCDVIGFNLQTGLWIGVEVKCGNDQVRPEQEVFIRALKQSGAQAWVIRDINSFKQAFFKVNSQAVSA